MYPFFGNEPQRHRDHREEKKERRIRGNHRVRGVIDADLVCFLF
jgi:hypothetical protein